MPQRPTRCRFLRCLVSAIAPSRQPECLITHFDASEGGGFVVECRGLICAVGQNGDGSWHLYFNIWITTHYPWGKIVTRRKVPSAALREQVAKIMGIETKLDGLWPYPSLVGKVRRVPDPNDLLGRMKKLMAGVELKRLYTEPDEALHGAR